MAERIKFYTDEHVPSAVTKGLRRRGVDVLTARERNLLTASDETQLTVTTREGTGGLSESQAEDLTEKLTQAAEALPATVWGAYTLLAAPSGATDDKPRLWMRQELGIRGYRLGEHSLARRV